MSREVRLAVTRRPWNRDGEPSREIYDFLLSRELQRLLDEEVQLTLGVEPGTVMRLDFYVVEVDETSDIDGYDEGEAP